MGRRGDRCGIEELDAAAENYERAWPDTAWADAPEDHRRLYFEVVALRYVEHKPLLDSKGGGGGGGR